MTSSLQLTTDIYIWLALAAAIAGCIDVIAGGGGLITIPALLAAGISPTLALTTNKLQAVWGSLIGSVHFWRAGMVSFKAMRWYILCTFIGAVAGALLLLNIDASSLKQWLPYILIATALYFLFSPNLGQVERKRRIPIALFTIVFCSALGFYDGFFGPGTGSFLALGFVSLMGMQLTHATAHAKVLNATSNLASLLVFLLISDVLWKIGLVMMAGQVIGASIGAQLVVKKGQKIIRPIVVLVCVGMAVRLLMQG